MWADSTLCSEQWGNESLISAREFYLYLLYQIHLLGALFHTLLSVDKQNNGVWSWCES